MATGMTCPACGWDTMVTDSRAVDDGSAIRRRRRCTACAHRFTSYEFRDAPDVAAALRALAALIEGGKVAEARVARRPAVGGHDDG